MCGQIPFEDNVFLTVHIDFVSCVPVGVCGLGADGPTVVRTAWLHSVEGVRRDGVQSATDLSRTVWKGQALVVDWARGGSSHNGTSVEQIHLRVRPGDYLEGYLQEFLQYMCPFSVEMT